MVGSRMSLDTKVSDRALAKFHNGKGSRLCELSGSSEKERDLFFGVPLVELETKVFCLNNCSGLSNTVEGSRSG